MFKKIVFFILTCFFLTACTKVNQSSESFNLIVKNDSKLDLNAPVVIYGDTRNNYEVHKQVLGSFSKKSPSIIFNTGDLVYNGNQNELWPTFYNIIKPVIKTSRYYPVLGNHERDSINYFKLFNLPNNERWYQIDYNSISFFLLDSNSDLSPNSKQYLWLNSKLENNKSKYKVLIFHHPLFSVGRHGGKLDLRKNLAELIKKYKIQLVFNGHDHSYQRLLKDNTSYIITGGGGAPLYSKDKNAVDNKFLKKYLKKYHYCLLSLKNDKILLEVYDINNFLIDSLTI